jgi:hypothetical protein
MATIHTLARLSSISANVIPENIEVHQKLGDR